MNLFEVMLVLVTMLLLGSGIACLVAGTFRSSRVDQAKTDLRVVEAAAEIYEAQSGGCPASVGELLDRRLLSRATRVEDPWNEELFILCQAGQHPVIISRGPDRQLATADDLRSDRLDELREDPGGGLKLVGMILSGAPLLGYALLMMTLLADRLGSSPRKNEELKLALEGARVLVGEDELEPFQVISAYRWWSTTLAFYPARPGSVPVQPRSDAVLRRLDVEVSGFSFRVGRGLVRASRRGLHAEPEVLAEVIRVAVALARAGSEVAHAVDLASLRRHEPYR